MSVIEEIAAERRRQIEEEGWSAEHDDAHQCGQMATAAACYALFSDGSELNKDYARLLWPWEDKWWKPKGERRNLIRSCALLVAEIERLGRAKASHSEDEGNGKPNIRDAGRNSAGNSALVAPDVAPQPAQEGEGELVERLAPILWDTATLARKGAKFHNIPEINQGLWKDAALVAVRVVRDASRRGPFNCEPSGLGESSVGNGLKPPVPAPASEGEK